jgi:hypothetical protein
MAIVKTALTTLSRLNVEAAALSAVPEALTG